MFDLTNIINVKVYQLVCLLRCHSSITQPVNTKICPHFLSETEKFIGYLAFPMNVHPLGKADPAECIIGEIQHHRHAKASKRSVHVLRFSVSFQFKWHTPWRKHV